MTDIKHITRIKTAFVQDDWIAGQEEAAGLGDMFRIKVSNVLPVNMLHSGSGSPEGAVTAPVGTLYTDTAGGESTTLYVKETGTGNTGWVAK